MAHTIWLTGLSGSGKTTLSSVLRKTHVILDGDVIRTNLSKDLGFSPEDRKENIRRVANVCKVLNDMGINVCVSMISPFEEERLAAKRLIGDCYIIYCNCPLHVCEERDIKGLYRKAREGKLNQFTGIDSPYEPPLHPDFVIDTTMPLKRSAEHLLSFVEKVITTDQ